MLVNEFSDSKDSNVEPDYSSTSDAANVNKRKRVGLLGE